MEFKSQLCTTREQSERLLSMGLKRETADCYYLSCDDGDWFIFIPQATMIRNEDIPAWSFHRLWEIGNLSHIIIDKPEEIPTLYNEIITNIEDQIAEGSLSKEYLEERVWKG